MSGSPVYFTTMTDIDGQDDKLIVLNPAKNLDISDAVSPEVAKRLALQQLAELSRIVEQSDPAQ